MPATLASFRKKRILVTGAHGFVGRHLLATMIRAGVPRRNIVTPTSREADLRKRSVASVFTKNIDVVIHLAGNVGGIGKNRKLPGTLFYDNAIMGIELIEAARKNNVAKFVTVGTVCAYPKYTTPPFNEDDLWIGYPEETNAAYGLAKKMLLVQSQAYRQQYGFNAIYLLPVNMYGPGDDFDLEDSHVIPAMIRKFRDAMVNKKPSVTLWGDGSPTREFSYVEDAARAIFSATIRYDKPEPVNIGSGRELSIRELAETIARLVRYTGTIVWDKSRPNGQPRRLLDVTRAQKEFGFKARTGFESGLKKTIKWYSTSNKKSR